ncbi:STAS domain-containing protein [Streptomyces broussonetiae]|uniref:STAS domain-containing protein n=2 Tax=Streptomyces broussonetiae TaxID=2686304 RepID=A0A6I6N2L9_9ACTN|nr:STAS domain-containing protein [Streptomyces broussonetiae]QHA05762.1 STAS domain-containing protein [Streptomyces broussonetiae]
MPTLTSGVGGKRWSVQSSEPGPTTALRQYECRGAWVVAAHGSYDMHSSPPLAEALDAAVRKHAKVVLDASGVDFADSTFLNLLILAHQAGTLRVAAPPAQLQRLFEITGTDTILVIRETVTDAAAA